MLRISLGSLNSGSKRLAIIAHGSTTSLSYYSRRYSAPLGNSPNLTNRTPAHRSAFSSPLTGVNYHHKINMVKGASTTSGKRARSAAGGDDLSGGRLKATSSASHGTEKTGMAHDLVAFCNYAWTPYHAVEEASRRLLAAGVV